MERGDGEDPLERTSDTDAGTRPDNDRELRRASRAGLLVAGVLSILLIETLVERVDRRGGLM